MLQQLGRDSCPTHYIVAGKHRHSLPSVALQYGVLDFIKFLMTSQHLSWLKL